MRDENFHRLGAVQSSAFIKPALRARLLRFGGARIGEGTRIMQGSFFGLSRVEIGRDCFISVQCLFDGSGEIIIGDNVYIAPRAHFITGSHVIGDRAQRAGQNTSAAVRIGNGCWIGAEAVIMPGVTIAPGCVIGARSMVRRDTSPNGTYYGAPAKREGELSSS